MIVPHVYGCFLYTMIYVILGTTSDNNNTNNSNGSKMVNNDDADDDGDVSDINVSNDVVVTVIMCVSLKM
jgi:hypothetical protein